MKIIILICLVAVFPLAGVKAQNLVHDENAEIRTLESFKGIEVSGSVVLYLSQGKEQAVAVSADEAQYVSKIKTVVKDGILKISPDNGAWNGWNWRNRRLKAYITFTTLSSIHLRGASSVRIADPVTVDVVKLDISGASSFKGTLNGKSMKLEVSGASTVELKGGLESLSMEVSGASSVKAYDLVAENCSIELSGASVANVTANKELRMEASGASSIGYKGPANVRRVESSGASSIKKRD